MDKKENAEKMMKKFFRLKDADMYRFWLNVCLCYGIKIDEKWFRGLHIDKNEFTNAEDLLHLSPEERKRYNENINRLYEEKVGRAF